MRFTALPSPPVKSPGVGVPLWWFVDNLPIAAIGNKIVMIADNVGLGKGDAGWFRLVTATK